VSDLKLVHHAAQAITALEPRAYPVDFPAFKPNGLWLSVEGEDSWQAWCEAERFNLGALTFVHDVELRPGAAVLRLSTAAELDAFTKTYWQRGELYPKLAKLFLDWERVARDYGGIVIAPYVWERRLTRHTFWYYGWDCASGCIWDLSAIAAFRLRA